MGRRVYFRTYFLDFSLNGFEIIKGFRALSIIPQESGGMIDGGHPNSALFLLLAMLTSDFVIGSDQPTCRNPAQTDDDLGADDLGLLAQPWNAVRPAIGIR